MSFNLFYSYCCSYLALHIFIPASLKHRRRPAWSTSTEAEILENTEEFLGETGVCISASNLTGSGTDPITYIAYRSYNIQEFYLVVATLSIKAI